MIFCRELNKNFDDETSLFAELKANKEDILSLKKAQIQKSCEKGTAIVSKSLGLSKLGEEIKNFPIDDNYHYIAVNATKILDSHGDLHVDGIWKKTIKDQQGKNYLLTDHKMEMASVVAKKNDVEMMTAEIPFNLIGKSYEGNTEALIYKIAKDKIIHPVAKNWLESGDDLQASVRMRYIHIKVAFNSTRPEDIEEFKTYNEYVEQIANKDDFESILYFWVVSEAENVKESSLVLSGSNSSTGPISNNKEEPLSNTPKNNEPSNDTSNPEETTIQAVQKRKKSII